MKIFWTRQAVGDLSSALDCAACEKPTAVPSVVQVIKKSVASLLLHPEMGRPGRVKGTREMVVPGTPLLLSYGLRNDRVEILALIHGARKWVQVSERETIMK